MKDGIFSEERAQSEWNSVYMLIILIIAALLLIAVIKPMFQNAMNTSRKTLGGT